MALYQYQVNSKILGYPVDMCTWLPDGDLTDVPVLWMLHGANSECTEWFRETRLQSYLRGRKLAVVTVSVYNGFYVDMHYGPAYATFLEQEWVDTVRTLFPCLSLTRDKNYLAGASMGGFGAVRLAVNRPDLFCKVGSFAGSIEMATIVERYERGIQPGGDDFVWAFGDHHNMTANSNDPIVMARKCVQNGNMPEVYMVCGRDDFGYALNTIARDDLRLVGASVTWVETEGIHSFDAWDPQLPAFLCWLEKGACTSCR